MLLVLPRSGKTDEPATAREQLPYLHDSRVIAGMCVFIFGVGSVYVFYGYVTPYLQGVLGVSPIGTSAVLMGYGAMCMVSNLISGWVASRFGMKALIASFLVQAGLLFALFMVGGATTPGIVITLLIGLTMYVVSTPCLTMFMDVARHEHPKALTLAASTEPMAFNVGIAFGTAMGGAVVNGPGIQCAGLFGALFSLIACGIVVAAVRSSQRKRRAA